MSHANRSEYDQGVNTFSPYGRLLQVEYAIEAIKLGSTAVGIQTADGVVLAIERRIESKLLVPGSVKKLVKLDAHIGCAMSGLVGDARTLVNHARVETQNHWFTYNERIQVESTVQSVCDLALRFGEGGQARPFGVALLVAGVDENGPVLYQTDPGGTYTQFEARAIGEGSEGAQISLQEQYNRSLTVPEAQKIALEVLKQVMEKKITSENVEMVTITVENPEFRFCTSEEVEAILGTLSADALTAALEGKAEE
jgi:20S proteasome subunit alpha 5